MTLLTHRDIVDVRSVKGLTQNVAGSVFVGAMDPRPRISKSALATLQAAIDEAHWQLPQAWLSTEPASTLYQNERTSRYARLRLKRVQIEREALASEDPLRQMFERLTRSQIDGEEQAVPSWGGGCLTRQQCEEVKRFRECHEKFLRDLHSATDTEPECESGASSPCARGAPGLSPSQPGASSPWQCARLAPGPWRGAPGLEVSGPHAGPGPGRRRIRIDRFYG